MTSLKLPATMGEVRKELAHFGVKGMQWGVRKKKPTSAEIHGARSRQAQRLRELQRIDDEINSTATSKSKSTALTKKANKVAKDFQTNEDRVTAARMTRGEKAANILLLGPIGVGAVVINRSHHRAVARRVDQLRENGPS